MAHYKFEIFEAAPVTTETSDRTCVVEGVGEDTILPETLFGKPEELGKIVGDLIRSNKGSLEVKSPTPADATYLFRSDGSYFLLKAEPGTINDFMSAIPARPQR